ncbi:MAG: BlaI/MecI/CopY family transcriptional regulator [Candidatus Kapabacteria bacterium]|nr:BlaI/MecI/CopY family transcriptional regulator [Candidatus Kapabacteria bacterium]
MKELTRAEEQVMQILWDLKEGFVRDVISKFPEPKPASTTVATVIRILENKGFVSHKTYGNSNMYFPNVTKADYARNSMKTFVAKYFENSYCRMVSFFAKDGELSIEELENIRQLISEKEATIDSDTISKE